MWLMLLLNVPIVRRHLLRWCKPCLPELLEPMSLTRRSLIRLVSASLLILEVPRLVKLPETSLTVLIPLRHPPTQLNLPIIIPSVGHSESTLLLQLAKHLVYDLDRLPLNLGSRPSTRLT